MSRVIALKTASRDVGAKLRFQQQTDGLHIQLPAQAPGKYAYAFRVVRER
jgi:hypothetical protein